MTNKEINIKLKGKEVYGFKFEKSWAPDMNGYIGKIGVIGDLHPHVADYTCVKFNDDNKEWCYPTKELEDHLVEQEQEPVDLTELFNQIKQL